MRTYYKDLTGARKQKTKRGFDKKSEALEWERNFKLKEDQSISMSFKSFVDIYLTDLEPRIKRNTFLTKKHIIETKILPYFGKRKLDDIRTSDVIQWQNEIMKLKKDNGELFSPTYLKTIHNQLSAILNHAVNMYGLKDNVARKAGTMGKEENKEMEFWTQEEFQAFLECVADKPISYYAFEILYWTGIREGELLALTPGDFNFEKKTLRINKSYQRLEGKDVITDPKTPKSNRTIVMPDFLAVEMEDFISSLYGIRDDDRIFTISKSYLHHEMDRGAKLAGVKRIRIHGLRHSHISLLINLGFSALAIGERVGHEAVDITYHYAQKAIEEAQKEADKWMMMSDTAKWQTEQAQIKLEEAERLKKELLKTVDGDDYLKEQVIELRYQNQMLREENRSLKDKLEKAYEFMKQFVIGGMNLLEKFWEWIGEKVRDVGRGR